MSASRRLTGDAGIALLLCAAGLFWMITAPRYGFWQGFGPRPGFLPFCYGALLFVLSAAILVRGLKEGRAEPAERDAHPWKPLLLVLVIAATLLGMNVVGFVAAVFVALVVMFVAIERLPVVRSIVVASATTAVFHLLLAVWLGVPLPAGPFGF